MKFVEPRPSPGRMFVGRGNERTVKKGPALGYPIIERATPGCLASAVTQSIQVQFLRADDESVSGDDFCWLE
jgi:hypothetical protein